MKIGTSLRNFRDRISASVSFKMKNVLFFFALFLVFFLAIMIRMTPVLRGPTLIKAFDPWIQYYNAKYLSEHTIYEYFHWHDDKSWYPGGADRYKLRPGLTFTVVIIYWILRALGLPITLYEVCFYFPAFMGGFTVLAMYFLGKEMLDRNCGLLAAFFLAFNPGHMQRTMAGFFDNETIGVFAVIMTFLFFLKTVKTGKFSYSIIGGIFLGYLSLSWGGYQYVFFILPIVCIVMIIMNKYNENFLIASSGVLGTGILIYALYVTFDPTVFYKDASIGGIFLFIIALLIFHLIFTKRHDIPRFYNGFLNTVRWAVIPGVIILAVLIWMRPDLVPLGIGGRLNTVLSPLMRDKMHIVASVAEHAPSSWGIFYYNTLIPLILLPLGIFFCFKRLDYRDIFMMVFVLTLFYFTGSMIRIILLFAPAASLMGAYGLVNVLKIYGSFIGEKRFSVSRKRKRQLKRTVGNSEVFGVYFLVGFLCVAQVFHASDLAVNQLSYSQMVTGGEYHDWEEMLSWMRNNLDGTDVVVSWWDYGYWLTPIGNVTTVNDNATVDDKRIGLVGMALMQTNEIYSAKIFKELEANYVLVYFGFLIPGLGGDEGKWPWMLRICNDHYEHYKDQDYEEDNWENNMVFDESEYVNETSGLYRENWFQCQLVRLMFGYEPTDPYGVSSSTDYLRWYYASQVSGNPSAGIRARKDDEGNEWSESIPDDGEYDFKVFKEEYFTRNGLVKLYKLDYTALESSFLIHDAKVFDNGYATFNLENDGERDLRIKNVKINDEEFDFTMGSGGYELEENDEDTVWVKATENYEINDVINLIVTAEADALDDKTYTFTRSTLNFFVSEAEEGAIQINRENSKVEHVDDSTVVVLEVENTGDTIENLEKFYINNEGNSFNDTEYFSGSSSVIAPGDKTTVKLLNADELADFSPTEGINAHMIGVKSSLGVKDETLFSFNSEDIKLSILSEERNVSPELLASTSNSTYRNHIPIDFSTTGTHVYDNGNIIIKMKNNGDIPVSLDSVYIAESSSVKNGNSFELREAIDSDYWATEDADPNLIPGQVNTIIVDGKGLDFDMDINDELVMCITASFGGSTVASDVGLIHVINDDTNVQIIEKIDSLTASYILANETGVILAKNTGNEAFNIQNIQINGTAPLNLKYIYGDASLNRQECALMSFDIQSSLKINKTDDVSINVTTTPSAEDFEILKALENPPGVTDYYDIEIDTANTEVIGNDLQIRVNNYGKTTVTVDSVYINDTYVDINEFTGAPYEIASDGSIDLIIDRTTLENMIPSISSIDAGDKLKILVRTREGAEDEEDNHIV